MENLIFCLNATIPVFITMIFGYFFKRIHLFDAAFLSKMNKFVFVAALPVLLFEDISTTDLRKAWDISFVIFCFLATLLSILFSIAVSYRLKDRSIQGEFVQDSTSYSLENLPCTMEYGRILCRKYFPSRVILKT